MSSERFFVAQIGRTVGLHGDLKLNLHTDFPEQFFAGAALQSSKGPLTVIAFDPKRLLIRFEGYASREDARKLTNTKIYSSLEATKEQCELGEGQYFWFDIIGSELYDGEQALGSVEDIERLADVDYLRVKTAEALVKEGAAKSFLVPYLPRYILGVNTEAKRIDSCDTRDLLDAS